MNMNVKLNPMNKEIILPKTCFSYYVYTLGHVSEYNFPMRHSSISLGKDLLNQLFLTNEAKSSFVGNK